MKAGLIKKAGRTVIYMIVAAFLILVLLLSPAGTVWGILSGRIDMESLEPEAGKCSIQEQIREEAMIQGGFGGY